MMAVSYAEFHWRSAPLSHGPTVTLVAVWYVLLALLAKRACDQRTPPKHTSASYVLAAHSAVLAVASLVMCAGALREAFARSALEGSWSWFFCENRLAAPKLYFWAYAYYLSKYYELLDTFLPVLVHGRVPRHFGMHVFHHACVLFMSWGYLEYRQTLAFGGGQQKRAKFPTSKAHISAVFHSFWLIFGRAIISRDGLGAWMLLSERARAEHSR